MIGPAALICLEIYAHLWSHWIALAGYFVLLAFGYRIFQRARKAEWEGRCLDNRALAEALRVQFFWHWAGHSDCAAEHYLRHLRGELGWIRQASRTCFLLTSGALVCLGISEVRLDRGRFGAITKRYPEALDQQPGKVFQAESSKPRGWGFAM